ncbi:hypothetical protein [Streptomyces sp. NPDC001340]
MHGQSRLRILSEDFDAQMTGAEHTAKRKIVVRGFTGQALQDQIRAVQANAAELIAPFLPRGRLASSTTSADPWPSA